MEHITPEMPPRGSRTPEAMAAWRQAVRDNAVRREHAATSAIYDRAAQQRVKRASIRQRYRRSHEPLVYFLRCGEFVKIGWTVSLEDRRGALQTANPEPLVLLGTMPGGLDVERRLHRILGSDRHAGEWFCLTPRVRRALRLLGVPDGG